MKRGSLCHSGTVRLWKNHHAFAFGRLDSPRKGKILYDGTDIKEYGLDKHRQEHVAFIFQGYNLIEYMTVKENVELTARLSVEEALEKVGLSRELWNRNVLKLSGGQQQRVAIARGLASNKPVIWQTSPTGNLDEDTAKGIMELLKKSAHRRKMRHYGNALLLWQKKLT